MHAGTAMTAQEGLALLPELVVTFTLPHPVANLVLTAGQLYQLFSELTGARRRLAATLFAVLPQVNGAIVG